MSIRCGNCRDSHETVAAVRACYGQPVRNEQEGATAKQLTFIGTLLTERAMTVNKDLLVGLSKREASDMITSLIATPKPVAPTQVREASAKIEVPAGYYATPSATGNNDLDFWRVDRPEDGKWQGYVFVKRILGGHEPRRISRPEQNKALEAIEDFGIQQAAEKFGQELGRCYRCGRSLTDETSRSLGIGPDCRSRAA